MQNKDKPKLEKCMSCLGTGLVYNGYKDKEENCPICKGAKQVHKELNLSFLDSLVLKN